MVRNPLWLLTTFDFMTRIVNVSVRDDGTFSAFGHGVHTSPNLTLDPQLS